jgi:hypothetical protein
MAATQKPPPEVAGPKTIQPQPGAHNIYVGLIGELIGVAALAVFADMDDRIGNLAVVLMVGWFILFLTFNSPWLATVIPGAKKG